MWREFSPSLVALTASPTQTCSTGNIERGPLSKESLKVGDQKGTEPIFSNSHLTGNTMALNSYLSIVILKVNGLNAPIKRPRVSDFT